MFQYRKILMMHEEGFSLRSIASSTGHSRQKITEVVNLAKERGLDKPLEEKMTDQWLEEFFFPEKSMEDSGRKSIDFDYIHQELGKKNVNLKLLHHEYEQKCREEKSIPYSYRSFLRHYRNYAQKHKATLRIQRKPGETMEVDWAGSTAFIYDRDTGEKVKVYLFVATLPCSQYSYVEGFLSMNLEAWITAHRNAYAYFGGVTDILVPDNLKTGVQKHTRQKLILNPTYRDMANHYQTAVIPTRIRSPKDKASVEGSVRTLSTWIIAALRNSECFSIQEINEEIHEKLEAFNHRDFTKREGSRWSAFLEEEKQHLSPLPPTPYKISEWLTAKVQPDYHVSIRSQFYSVPHEYISQQVEAKVTDDLIQIFYHRMRIATHSRLYGKYGQQSTHRDHMPENHKQFMDQTSANTLAWAKSIGRSATRVVEHLLETAGTEKQGIKKVYPLKKTMRYYTKYELEKACMIVLEATSRPTVALIQTTLKNQKATEEEHRAKYNQRSQNYGFTRGAAYYGRKFSDES